MRLKQFWNQQKTLTNFLSSSMFAIPVSLVTSFISLRNIEPELMGIWVTVAIFQNYAAFFGIGVVNGMNRELPFALGQGKQERAREIASTSLSYVLLQASVYIVVGIAMTLILNKDYYFTIAICTFALKLIIDVYSQYLASTYRSNSDFNKLSKAQWWSSIFRLLSAPLIFLGFEGFLLYMVLFDLSRVVLLHWWRPIRVKPIWHSKGLVDIIKVGFPIFIAGYLTGLIDSIPRLFILNKGGTAALGLFAPVTMLFGVFIQFSGAFQNFTYPRFTYRFGQGESLANIVKSNIKIIVSVVGAMVLLLIPLYFALDYFVDVFPKYEKSAPYLYMGLLVVPFITHKLTGVVFVVGKNFKYMYAFQVVKFLLLSGGIYASLRWSGLDVVNAVILAMAVTYFLMLMIGLYMNLRMAKEQN